MPSKDAKTKKYILSGLLVAFLTGLFSIQAAAATTFTLTTDTYTYTDDGYYNLTIRTPRYNDLRAAEDPLGTNQINTFNGIDFEIIGGPDPSGAAVRYINGYFNLRVKIYFDFEYATDFSDIYSFNYEYTAPVLEHAFFASGRPQIYTNSTGFYLQIQLYGFFDNFIFHDNEQFSFGKYTFDFTVAGPNPAYMCDVYADVSSMTNKSFTVTNHASSSGSVEIISLGVQDAINNASDINTIISLLSAANGYDVNILQYLQTIGIGINGVNNNLAAVITAINEIGEQTNQSLQQVVQQLDTISSNTENIMSQMPDFDLASVSSDIQALYAQVSSRIPYFPTQADQTALWSWLNLPIPFYFLGFTLIFALMGYIVYGKNK